MDVTIRNATKDDVRDIRNVYYKTWLATYPSDAHGILVSDIEDMYKDTFTEESILRAQRALQHQGPEFRTLVALVDGNIVGTSRLKRGETRDEIRTIYILPEYQGQGVGKALFVEAVEWFGEGRDIQIDVAVYNYPAIKFYEGLGFVATGEVHVEGNFRMPSGGIIREQRMLRKG